MSPSCAWLRGASPRSTSLGVSRGRTLRSNAALGGSKSLSWLHGPGRRHRSSAAVESGGACSSLAVPSSTLQVTARGWLASYDNRLSQNFWSKQGNKAAAGVGVGSSEGDRLPPVASDTARRENYKKEHYSTELDRIAKGNEDSGSRRQSKEWALKRAKTLEQLSKEVNMASDIRSEIDHLMKNAHDQHRHFKPQKIEYAELSQQEERDREQAKKAEPVVRRRKRTDQPRNPKWRVEERIKRERALWKDTGEAPICTENLPMTQFAVQSDHGKAEFSLVDVKGIQAKCRNLSANVSAKTLLEQERLKEEAGPPKKSSDYSGCKAELDALAALSWEDRLELAQRKKLQGHISGVFNKMGAMRSKYPKEVPDSIVNHLYAMSEGDFSWNEQDF